MVDELGDADRHMIADNMHVTEELVEIQKQPSELQLSVYLPVHQEVQDDGIVPDLIQNEQIPHSELVELPR